MDKNKKGFWRNFTWKKFLLIAVYMFAITLIIGCLWNYLSNEPVSALFTSSELLHRAFTAIIAGFVIYLLNSAK